MKELKRLRWNIFFRLPGLVVRWVFNQRWFTSRYFPKGYSTNGLEEAISDLADSCQSKTYIELGANDGIRQSNTKRLEENGWSGILIEPIPKHFSRLKKTRSLENFFVQSACVSFDHGSDRVELVDLDLMSSSGALVHKEFNSENHMKRGKLLLASTGAAVSVKAESLSPIIDRSKFGSEIGIMSLDVEGAELSVLGGIDFDRHSFEYMVIETSVEKEVSSFLSGKGYQLLRPLTHHDYLYSKSS